MEVNLGSLQSVFRNGYFDLCESSHSHKQKISSITYVSVSTMTIIADLCLVVDILKLNHNFRSTAFPKCEVKELPSDSVSKKKVFIIKLQFGFRIILKNLSRFFQTVGYI